MKLLHTLFRYAYVIMQLRRRKISELEVKRGLQITLKKCHLPKIPHNFFFLPVNEVIKQFSDSISLKDKWFVDVN